MRKNETLSKGGGRPTELWDLVPQAPHERGVCEAKPAWVKGPVKGFLFGVQSLKSIKLLEPLRISTTWKEILASNRKKRWCILS